MIEENFLIYKRFDQVVNQDPQRIAIQIKKDGQWQSWTYARVREEALRVAAFLKQEGALKDCVCLALETRPEWVFIYLGVLYAGMTCVPLDAQLNTKDLRRCISNCASKILFCSKEIYEKKIDSSLWQVLGRLIVLDAPAPEHRQALGFSQLGSQIPQKDTPADLNQDDIASLIYTSGTTDIPKAVLLTHKNICSNFISLRQLQLCSSEDNFLSLLPLHHTYPFMATVILPLLSGARITFCPAGFNPGELAALVKEAKVSILAGVPQLFALFYHSIIKKLSHLPPWLRALLRPYINYKIRFGFGHHLRLMVSGGARLDPKIAKGMAGFGFTMVEGYGLTETSPVATFNPLHKIKYGSVGRPIPDVQIKILEPDPGGVGQVLIKGPNVMRGYFKQPQVTESVIKDGWFYSGDLGYLDDEGYLFLTGRAKEVIVLGSGKNIYPEELESRFIKSPFIKEICVIDKKEERFGQEVDSLFAIVVPDLEHFQRVREKNIRGKIRWELENFSKDLPGYQHIMGFTLTREELPKTALKKLKRYEVKEKYLKEKSSVLDEPEAPFSPQDLEGLNPPIAQKIISYLIQQIHIPVKLEQHLEIDLGIDSLTRVELALGIEKMFGVKIPDEDFYVISTVRDLVGKVSVLTENKQELEKYDRQIQQTSWAEILHKPPSPGMVSKINLTPGMGDWILTALFKCLYWIIFKLFCFLRIKKIKPLELKGPYIICSNHASYLDGFIVFCGLPLRVAVNTYFVGLSAIFDHPSVRWAQRFARLVPIDSNANFTESMQMVSFLLANKKIVCIFPEGQRSIGGEVKEFKKGIGIILKELNVSAVPVRILGSHFAWPRTRKFPRPYPVKAIFGAPFSAKALVLEKKLPAIKDYTRLSEGLREQVVKLGS